MRHILMTADAVGGVWTYAIDLARALGERGIAVTLAVMGPDPSEGQFAEARALPLVTVHHMPFRLEWMDQPWRDVDAAGKWLLDLERETGADVVHLNGYCHATLPWRAPVLVTAHSCVLSWWEAVYGTEPPLVWDRYAARVTEGLYTADVVVAPTAAMLRALTFHYGPLRRTKVIPNGRHEPFEPFEPSEPSEPQFVFSSGRIWDPAKNIELLAQCASEIPWPVYVAGDTASPSGGVTSLPSVTTLGRLTPVQVRTWMQRASLYALPARYEPFGLSILEAALQGCALVLGDIRSLREVWGDAALYVPTENRRALIAALRNCIEDTPMREDLSARARARAREFTVERMADGYCTEYEQLVTATAVA